MPRVLVSPVILRRKPGRFHEILEQAGFEVVYPDDTTDTMIPSVLERELVGIDAMLASTESITRPILASSKLRVIARMGVGFDAIDIPAATDHNIAVTITPGTLEESAAEHTVALLLGVTRGLVGRDREVRTGVWKRQALPRMAGRTFGLVGLGRIGKAVVPKIQGLGMRVIAADPHPDLSFARDHNVAIVSIDELLATADVVSLHSPSTPDTLNLINAETLARMKPGSVLINTARGTLVDEEALAAALASGHLLGAALDVFKVEPLPLTSPLIDLENVLLCSHMGGLDEESVTAASSLAAQCIVDLHRGHWPEQCVVNKPVRESWRW
jgi:D-3-phosphoglycerate dehydrogenase / 2-oxoglutarate reductase